MKNAADELWKRSGNREISVIPGPFLYRNKNIPKNYVYAENQLTNQTSFANMLQYACEKKIRQKQGGERVT